MMEDFAALPPEINSARIYSGPGSSANPSISLGPLEDLDVLVLAAIPGTTIIVVPPNPNQQ